jgi:hypothetical protein
VLFEVLMLVSPRYVIHKNIGSCSLEEVYRRFGGRCCLNFAQRGLTLLLQYLIDMCPVTGGITNETVHSLP